MNGAGSAISVSLSAAFTSPLGDIILLEQRLLSTFQPCANIHTIKQNNPTGSHKSLRRKLQYLEFKLKVIRTISIISQAASQYGT